MKLRSCAATPCKNRFRPYLVDQLYCSDRCASRVRMRRKRERDRLGGDDGGGGQRMLFRQPLLPRGKPPKPVHAPEPTLFEGAMAPRKAVARESRIGGQKGGKIAAAA